MLSPWRNKIRALIFIVALPVIGGIPSQAFAAQCDPLPKVDWWSKSHSKVIRSVNKKYGGNWDKYIARWQGYKKNMLKIQAKKGVAEVKSRKIKMRGKKLDEHIKQIDERLAVLECLKANATSGEVAETKKATKPKRTSNTNTQVATLTGDKFDVEVSASCSKQGVSFQVTNLGEKWPRLSTINIYRTDTKGVISKRRMRLVNSQQATFRVRGKKAEDVGEVGIWVEPSWFKRTFKYDAKINCSN